MKVVQDQGARSVVILDNQLVSFSISPYTEDDFTDKGIEGWSSVFFARIDGNIVREFSSLDDAKDNRDENLIWTGTRVD
jgi:hypothetical protein